MQSDLSLEFGILERATFLERPNRFLAICRLEKTKEIVQAHLADPGRMTGLLQEGTSLYLRVADKPGRKTKWSVILLEIQNGETFVSVQSALVNQLTEKVLKEGALTELSQWHFVRSEYSLGNSRWDFLLERTGDRQLLLEVKSVSLVEKGIAMFPDGVTTRGRRHLEELAEFKRQSLYEAAVLFVVQRSDARCFRPADHIDPAFAESLRRASLGGVQVFARNCFVNSERIKWGKSLHVDFS